LRTKKPAYRGLFHLAVHPSIGWPGEHGVEHLHDGLLLGLGEQVQTEQ